MNIVYSEEERGEEEKKGKNVYTIIHLYLVGPPGEVQREGAPVDRRIVEVGPGAGPDADAAGRVRDLFKLPCVRAVVGRFAHIPTTTLNTSCLRLIHLRLLDSCRPAVGCPSSLPLINYPTSKLPS